jgi:N6-adenosine-specific RNA methylase IME4
MTISPSIFAALPGTPSGWSCIAADPPLHFLTWSHKGQGRAPSRHYGTLAPEDVMTLPVRSVVAPSAWLFLWTTGPHLESAFKIMNAWDFEYSGIGFCWLKLRKGLSVGPHLVSTADLDREFFFGLGKTTRHNLELCLLGKRGKPKRLSASVREVIVAPVREHSRKPDEFYDRVERFCAGPRLNLFGRESRPGWTVYGDEATKFDREPPELPAYLRRAVPRAASTRISSAPPPAPPSSSKPPRRRISISPSRAATSSRSNIHSPSRRPSGPRSRTRSSPTAR